MRTSTSRSTTSGMVLVFWPPCATLGEIVVCAQASARRASPGSSVAIASSTRAGSLQRRPQVVGKVEAGELGRPQVVEAGHAPVLRQAAHHLGRGHERVVRPVRHRPVAGRSADPQAQPGEALLGDADGDAPHAVGTGRRPPAGLGEHVVGPDGVPVLRRSGTRPPTARRLPRRRRRSRSATPRGRNPSVASRRKATAIDDVMLSMSMAPRPHTSARPSAASTSSPPKGSRDHPSALTGTTSVCPIRHSDGACGS